MELQKHKGCVKICFPLNKNDIYIKQDHVHLLFLYEYILHQDLTPIVENRSACLHLKVQCSIYKHTKKASPWEALRAAKQQLSSFYCKTKVDF